MGPLPPSVQAGAETSDIGVEAVKPDPHCYWQGLSMRMDVDDESIESCKVVQPLRITSVIRPLRHTYAVIVRWTHE